jgi:phospholipase C
VVKVPLVVIVGGLLGCGGHGAASPPAAAIAAHGTARALARPRTATPIAHVVIIVQENRSFDNLFYGFPGADTATSGLTSTGQTVPLTPIGLEAGYDVAHGATAFFAACDAPSPTATCKMDGFDLERIIGTTSNANPQYGYVPASETQPYRTMASQYVLADRTSTRVSSRIST